MKIRQNFELINPTTGEKNNTFSYHTLDDAKSLLTTASLIQKKWKLTSIKYRIKIVEKSMDFFQDNLEAIARDITLQMGKPITQSRNEVRSMLLRAKTMCELAEDALQDITLSKLEGFHRFIRREPIGVVLDIAAWNYPLLIAVNIVVPAILAGNTVAIKHSSITPLCAKHFEDAFKNTLPSEGLVTALILDHATTDAIIRSGMIHHLAFTGSVVGGKKINESASGQCIDVGLELGGKDPAYIREDADLDLTVPNVMDGVFYNAGQSCCSIERIYIHHSKMNEFVDRAVQYMNKLKIGDPLDMATSIGPMAQESGIETIKKQLKDAKSNGANIKYHPGPLPNSRNYILPAILTNVNHNMDVMMKESFGPIVGIMGVDSDEQAIALMNDSPYGLTASVWTNDSQKAIEIGSRLDTGTFFMNRCDYLDPALPWVGVKDSGRGCTLSILGLQQLTRPKSYHLKLQN